MIGVPRLLVVLACVLVHSVRTKDDYCEKVDSVYQKLEWAEAMIRSAKEELPPAITIESAKEEVSTKPFPTDCEEVLNSGETSSGVYQVWPKNRLIEGAISVYCDMETDGGGWTVIQRRGDFGQKRHLFFQDWNAYKEGFGKLEKDFWLGNDKIYAISNQKAYSIRFDLTAFDESTAHALYDTFWIEEENNYYKLHVQGYSGNAGDSFSIHSGSNFSTVDRDNDATGRNCAESFKGAWWFKDCFNSHLNGIYPKGEERLAEGLIWSGWRGYARTLIATEMKIRKFPSWGT